MYKHKSVQSTCDTQQGLSPEARRMQFELSRDIAKLKEDILNRFIFKQINKTKDGLR